MRKKRLIVTIPKISIWIVSFLISFQLWTGMIVGYFIARFFAGSRTHQRGRIRSVSFSISNYKVHIHHWLICTGALTFVYFNNYSSYLLYGFLGGFIYQGLFYYNDWYKIFSRQHY